MHGLSGWFGFFGAWLLFAGPVYQGALELREEELGRESLHDLQGHLPPRVSPWWWLVPPVRLVLAHRRSKQVQEISLAVLSRQDVEQLLTYASKATGWLYVAVGGLLIALKETLHLVEEREWPSSASVGLAAAAALLSLSVVAVQARRSEGVLRKVDASHGTLSR